MTAGPRCERIPGSSSPPHPTSAFDLNPDCHNPIRHTRKQTLGRSGAQQLRASSRTFRTVGEVLRNGCSRSILAPICLWSFFQRRTACLSSSMAATRCALRCAHGVLVVQPRAMMAAPHAAMPHHTGSLQQRRPVAAKRSRVACPNASLAPSAAPGGRPTMTRSGTGTWPAKRCSGPHVERVWRLGLSVSMRVPRLFRHGSCVVLVPASSIPT